MINNILSTGWNINWSNWFVNWFYSPEFAFGIAKYAVCILSGIIIAYLVCTKESERFGVSKDFVLVRMAIIVPLAILGARIWYMFGDGNDTIKTYVSSYGFFKGMFYTLGYTVGFNPEAGTYEGLSGLAIHGGVIVAFVSGVIVCKISKIKVSVIADLIAPALLIGQICGRWGNFFNQEAHGIVVGGWTLQGSELIPNIADAAEQYDILVHKFMIPPFIAKFMYMEGEYYYYGIVDGVQKYGYLNGSYFFHPTFLYELLLNGVGLGIYFALRRQKWVRSGTFIGFYLIWYGAVRFFIEIVRTDSLYLGNTGLKLAQVSSLVMILIGILIQLYIYVFHKNDKYMDLIEKQKEINASKKDEKEKEEVVNI